MLLCHLKAWIPSFSVSCFPTRETHITSDMCSGAHISRGNTYHCDIGTSTKTAKVQSGLMPFVTQYNPSVPNLKNIAVVTLHTFALEKLDLLTVSLRKLNFSSGTDFSLPGGILSSGAWICHENNRDSLDSYPKARARANSNPKVTNQWTLVGGCLDDRIGNL